MHRITPKTKKIFLAILLSVFLLLWGAYLLSRFEIHSYRYLTVLEPWPFSLLAIAVPCVPLILWILSVIALRKRKKLLAAILLILYLPALAFSFFLGSVELLGFRTTGSYTTDMEHFGIFDRPVAEALELNLAAAFPGLLPEEAEIFQYCYFYQSGSSDIIYIAVTWQVEDEGAFNAFAQQHEAKPDKDTAYATDGLQVRDYFCNTVLTDAQTNQIGFVVTNQEVLLPSQVTDIIKDPAAILSLYPY